VSDAASQWTPGQSVVDVAFFRSIHTKVVDAIDGAFGAQDAAQFGERLVVQLDRVGVETVLDADAFLPFTQVADDFTREAFGHLPAERSSASKEAHDVATAQAADGMLEQARVEPPQLSRVPEAEVDRPLTLIGRPVVGRRMCAEELLVDGVQAQG